ncbi:MAG: hypothetical protein AB8F78_11420 [Saprospiraceae bacterium]
MHTHYQNLLLLSVSLLALSIVLSASSCSKEEQLANQIERNTPTELPPISQAGANTMGAYVTVGGERHLFVASGVERGGSIGTISADCEPFKNFLYQSTGNIVVAGTWCSRQEINRPIQMDMAVSIPTLTDSFRLSFGIDYDGTSSTGNRVSYISRGFSVITQVDTSRLDRQEMIVAGTFEGYAINFENMLDTALIPDGRFDVRYGLTQ